MAVQRPDRDQCSGAILQRIAAAHAAAIAQVWKIAALSEGMSALHTAAKAGRADIVRYLLDKGANTELVDSNGRKAIDLVGTGARGGAAVAPPAATGSAAALWQAMAPRPAAKANAVSVIFMVFPPASFPQPNYPFSSGFDNRRAQSPTRFIGVPRRPLAAAAGLRRTRRHAWCDRPGRRRFQDAGARSDRRD